MKLKQLSAIALSTAFSLGAVNALALDNDQDRDDDAAYQAFDQNEDGVIDREEARQMGITDEQFDQMDEAGDGEISAEEYREYHKGEHRRDTQERQEHRQQHDQGEQQDQQDDW